MAIGYIGVDSKMGRVGATTGGMSTFGANLIVVVTCGWSSSAGTLTDSKSNIWTLAVTSPANADNGVVRIYYCASPTVGTSHTFSTTAEYVSMYVAAFSGAAYSSPLISTSSAYGGSAASGAPGSITPTDNGALFVFGGPAQSKLNSTSLGIVNAAISHEFGAYYGGGLGHYVQPAAGSANPTLGWAASVVWTAAMAAFKAAADYTHPTLSNARMVWTGPGAGQPAIDYTW